MRKKIYFTEEERKEANKLKYRRYRAKNKAKRAKYRTDYRSTQFGRANSLLYGYKRSDKERNRGECTLTEDWIIENIFSQPCAHCGETDWRKLGCNRLDNSLPHTPDNVEPCCLRCNIILASLERERNKLGQYI